MECKYETNPRVIAVIAQVCRLRITVIYFHDIQHSTAFNIFKSQCNNKESEEIVRCEVQRKNDSRNLQWVWMQWGRLIAYF